MLAIFGKVYFSNGEKSQETTHCFWLAALKNQFLSVMINMYQFEQVDL